MRNCRFRRSLITKFFWQADIRLHHARPIEDVAPGITQRERSKTVLAGEALHAVAVFRTQARNAFEGGHIKPSVVYPFEARSRDLRLETEATLLGRRDSPA